MTTLDELISTLTDNVGEINTTCSHNLSSVDDVSSGTDEITCDVINTVTKTEIPTVEPNANDVKARSNVDEDSITVCNDYSNDTSIPAIMGKIKTY